MKNKIIMAYEKGRYKTMAEIIYIDDAVVSVYSKNNPKGCQYYDLKLDDVLQWIDQGLYKLRYKRKGER